MNGEAVPYPSWDNISEWQRQHPDHTPPDKEDSFLPAFDTMELPWLCLFSKPGLQSPADLGEL